MKGKGFNWSYVFVLFLFLAGGAFSWRLYFKDYSQKDTVDINRFPREIKGWTSQELTITEREYEVLETRNAFTRKYTSPEGKDVYLFIVYSQHNRKVSHPPEICYTGSGASFLSSKHVSFTSGDGRETVWADDLLLEFGRQQQVMFYWFKVGGDFTPNYWKQQMLIALKTLLNQPASSALIRLTTDVGDEPVEGAEQRLKQFGGMMIPYVQEYLP